MKIKMLVTALTCLLVLSGTCIAGTGRLSVHNCDEGTWVGGVKWNDDKTDYVDVPEIEIKHVGWLDVDVEAGVYALTHLRPRTFILDQDGEPFMVLPPAILDFRSDIVVKENTETSVEFGDCDK